MQKTAAQEGEAENATPAPVGPPPKTAGPSAEANKGTETPTRRSLDPAVANVLQEEARLETQARQKNVPETLEMQPDLGLKDADPGEDAFERARKARERMNRMRGEDRSPPQEDIAVATSVPRSAILPDIAEINSTLRSNNDRSPKDDPGQTAQVESRERRSFGRGFTVMVVLAAILVALYVFAPQLADSLPQAQTYLDAYVSLVDQWRLWLDTQVQAFLIWLDATVATSGS